MRNNKTLTILSHLITWLTLFSLPYLLSYGELQELNRVIAHFWIPLVFSAIIFYANYFILIDKLLFPKKMVAFFVINTIAIIIFLLIKEYIESTYFSDIARKREEMTGNTAPPFKMAIYIQTLSYLAPLLFSIAIKSTQRWVKTEAERKEAINIKLKSELQHLHYQLQPHFFFNSLNNIYAMVDISPDQAKTSIHSLSKLMRYMLYETAVESILLSKEIDFMKKYIDLMKLRVSDKTVVNYSFPVKETGIKIAPLLFISLIENAFKHGVSASKESLISIDMTCHESNVIFKIENDNFPKRTEDKSGSGIGLQNLVKRLELLYPQKHEFKTTLKANRFLVHLEIETS
ncbi:histidine kinase [Winogradskyella eckloniae]|uniref:sensor histidine kinase n=1 Tax=Winogradskyella eckloniae TaxID=1089306 RepID=UPI0015659089|nr:histidine kinase [Winogradskyella eckloniae]NRD20108.1 histidine kinase [Winogradskyella eckloniae]